MIEERGASLKNINGRSAISLEAIFYHRAVEPVGIDGDMDLKFYCNIFQICLIAKKSDVLEKD